MFNATQHRVSAMSGDVVLGAFSAQSAFAFSSPTRTMVAAGPLGSLERAAPEHVANSLKRLAAAGASDPCLVGCLPFLTPDQRSTGVLPRPYLCIAPHVASGQAMPWTDVDATEAPEHLHAASIAASPRNSDVVSAVGWSIDPRAEVSARRSYVRAVEGALSKIAAREVEKVVLARVLDLAPCALDGSTCMLDHTQMASLVRGVLLREPARFGFAVRLPAGPTHDATRLERGMEREPIRGDRWLFGVSPELLLRKRGPLVESHPLAGSIPRAEDAAVDDERAAQLLGSAKDLREHAFVVQAIADALAPYCRELDVPKTPTLVSTPTLWHLGTRIKGKLRDPNVTSYALALALHPTPAVCGSPTAAAKRAIEELEDFSRDYFTGMVGWNDAHGDGEWAVTIRCGELTATRLRLYAGAGVVAGSRPDAELRETDAKLRTLLRALRIQPLEEMR